MREPHVLSFSTKNTDGETVRFTVGTDIIDYMESSRVFGHEELANPSAHGRFQRRMVAIPDKKGEIVTPMVLTLSNQNKLYLVRKDDVSQNGDGWALIDLSQTLKKIVGESLRVSAFNAAWTENDRITIAVAVDESGDEKASKRSRVFVAYDLSSQTSDWQNIAWIDGGSRENVVVEGIRVLDNGEEGWTIVFAGNRGQDETLYLLRSSVQQSFAQAHVFNTAIKLDEILDFEVAVYPQLGRGIVVLGKTQGETRRLSFRPFPNYDKGELDIPPVQMLPCPPKANVIETGLTRIVHEYRGRKSFGSNIYIGGQGIHEIKAVDMYQERIGNSKLQPTVVVSPDAAPNVQDLVVAEAADGSAAGDLFPESSGLQFWPP